MSSLLISPTPAAWYFVILVPCWVTVGFNSRGRSVSDRKPAGKGASPCHPKHIIIYSTYVTHRLTHTIHYWAAMLFYHSPTRYSMCCLSTSPLIVKQRLAKQMRTPDLKTGIYGFIVIFSQTKQWSLVVLVCRLQSMFDCLFTKLNIAEPNA